MPPSNLGFRIFALEFLLWDSCFGILALGFILDEFRITGLFNLLDVIWEFAYLRILLLQNFSVEWLWIDYE